MRNVLDMETETNTQTMYTATTGTTCYLDGHRGVTTGRNMEAGQLVGMFVKLDGSGAMAYATVVPVRLSNMHHVITGWQVIDREAFDAITGLDEMRTELGWAR